MAYITYHNVGIRAVSACVPKNVLPSSELKDLLSESEYDKVINSTGILEKRYADDDVCSSDLCYKAAVKLLQDNAIAPETIDALIFVSQTADYRQPATAPLLQARLGLPTTTLSFDVNLACSGYVYGLSMAYAYASMQGINRVLLLVGETMSKTVSQHDRVATPLFGDAGTATLIEKAEAFGDSYFSLNSDGSGSDVIKMPYGGYRNRSCVEGLQPQTDTDGNIRTGEQFYMNGMAVFDFGISVEPKDIKNLVKFAELNINDLDLIVYHQANKLMTDFFTKRLRYSTDKTPYCIDRFGNTSSASIPLTLVAEVRDKYPVRNKVLISGFGAGLSWASAILDLSTTNISELIEY